jgi:hypothetical protein
MKKGVADAVNSFASAESVTTTILKQICLSDYTLESIRGLIIDPIKSKFIPKETAANMDEFTKNLWALFSMLPDKVAKEVFQFSRQDQTDELVANYRKDPEDALYYGLLYRTPDFLYKSGGKTYVFSYKGAFLYLNIVKDTKEWAFMFNLYFVGPNAIKVHKEFAEIRDDVIQWVDVDSKGEKFRKIVVISENSRGMMHSRSSTVPNTIITDHVEGDLNEIIKMVERSEAISDDFGINKTIGILLHGPHGTGKSTIARYLALVLNRKLILTTSDNLMNAIDLVQNRPNSKYILLIEDIDFMFTDRRKKKRKTKTSDEEVEEVNDDMNKRTSLLFQVLDGVLSSSNLIVIATTNYFDRLDPALIRDGRFDYKIELKGLDYETAAKVCERFDVRPDEISLESWKTPIAPATLQTVLLRYKVTNKNTYDPNKLTDVGEEN